MSSTNRGAERVISDAYYTPDHVARACVEALSDRMFGRVWEPHGGGGAFARAAARLPTTFVYASDISPRMPDEDELDAHGIAGWAAGHDALDGCPFDDSAPQWIIGNPPFDEAQAHIEMAIHTATVGCAFLLRLGFLEGQERQDTFWSKHPCAEFHSFVRRPSFLERYEDGTIGPLRKRDKEGAIELDKHGNARKAGTDSAAYGWFIWRRGWSGDTRHRFLSW